jgi:hypothetical protein
VPWTPKDAVGHDVKATGKKAKQWSAVANAVLQRTGSDAEAVKQANGVIKAQYGRYKRKNG